MLPLRHHHRALRSFLVAAMLALASLSSTIALAGEIKFGASSLQTDDNGKLTDAARGSTVKQIENTPGEEIWPVSVWAKLDRGAPGPCYIEFYDKHQGKRYMVWRYEHSEYEGTPYLSVDLELEGNNGFNKDHTYEVEVVQVDEKGKNVKLASGATLKLVKTNKEPPKSEEEEEEEEEENEDGDEGDRPRGGDGASSDEQLGPPPVEPPVTKRGCSIDSAPTSTPWAWIVLTALGIRRRRASID